MKRALCLLAALPLLLILAGCGGGGGGSSATSISAPTTTTPSTLSKADFIKQGDAICAEVNSAIDSLSGSGTSSSDTLGQQADLYGGMVERLKALGTPSDGSGLDSVYSAAGDLVSAEQKAQLASQRGDNAGVQSAQSEASSALGSFQSAASSYGFQDCGSGTSSSVISSGTGTSPGTSTSVAPVTPAAPTTTPAAPVAPAPAGGTAGTTGGGSTGGGSTGGGTSSGGTSGGSGGVGPG